MGGRRGHDVALEMREENETWKMSRKWNKKRPDVVERGCRCVHV